jgi:pyruvate/2-oxoglutarate dehydrogenase complex dihydrolipoamide acyltransferase (E2) component
MFRLAAVTLTLFALSSGCTRRQQDFAWFAVAVAAEVAKASNAATESSSGPGVAEAAPDPDDYPPPSAADLQRANAIASELTRIAAHDARTDHCEAVVRTSNHVRVIDPAVFANVFLRDPPIQRCLALAPEPALTSGVTLIE